MKVASELFALRSYRVLLASSVALGAAMCALPLVSVLGVESALCLGIVLPPMASALAARIALSSRRAARSNASVLGESLVGGLSLLVPPLVLLALNALRVRNCAPLEGLLFAWLGPGAGVALASLAGALVGSLPLAPRAATAAAALLPVVPVVLSLVRFYATPGIFAYGHFFGYFAGTLYDEVVGIPDALWTLRAVTLCWGLGIACLILWLRDPATGRLAGGRRSAIKGVAVLASLALLIGAAGEVRGATLGHHASSAHIAQTLGGMHRSERCVIHHARELRRERLLRFAADCDVRVQQLERWFGLRHPRPIRVYLFRSAGEKRQLMGAAGTNLAKPWRNEIYLQEAGWPHPVLPHELAHVVAANVGRGPLRVTGALHGMWPDLALIEGVAVAAVWPQSSRSGMTPHQWTRAMLELGIVPPLSKILGAGFLGQQKRMAYTLSGSLLRFVAETRGRAAIAAIYQRGDVAAALGLSLPELERRWHAYVRQVPLPDAGRALVQQRFSGRSILTAVCPHHKAELEGELWGLLAAGRDEPAAEVCREILDIDASEDGIRAALVGILARLGRHEAAEAELARLRAPPPASPSTLFAARQLLADEAWRAGKRTEALQAYRSLLDEPMDRDARRQIEVKALALAEGGRQSELIFELLVGSPGAPIDGAVAVHLIRELRRERVDGLPHYLEARQLFFRERYAEAASLLAEARDLGLPSRDLAIEALRVEAISRSALSVGRQAMPAAARSAAALWWKLEHAPGVDLALQAEASDFRSWLRLR